MSQANNQQDGGSQESDPRPCYVCGERADLHPWIPDRDGWKRGPCPIQCEFRPFPAPASGNHLTVAVQHGDDSQTNLTVSRPVKILIDGKAVYDSEAVPSQLIGDPARTLKLNP